MSTLISRPLQSVALQILYHSVVRAGSSLILLPAKGRGSHCIETNASQGATNHTVYLICMDQRRLVTICRFALKQSTKHTQLTPLVWGFPIDKQVGLGCVGSQIINIVSNLLQTIKSPGGQIGIIITFPKFHILVSYEHIELTQKIVNTPIFLTQLNLKQLCRPFLPSTSCCKVKWNYSANSSLGKPCFL